MSELLSRIDICHAILGLARRRNATPKQWEINPDMWREIAMEAGPPLTEVHPYIETPTLLGIPVDVSFRYPGIDLRII